MENSSIQNERNYYLDFLKVFGLALIILAHVPIPDWLSMIRNFDVPLMVFISGCLANGSFERSENVFTYFKKRIFRLLIPTWIFLSVYFLLLYIFTNNGLPGRNTILKSYLLQNDSIGFVWIIRIYLLCAFSLPFLKKIDFSKLYTFGIVVFVYILYELSCKYRLWMNYRIIECTVYYLIPYGIVLLFGLNWKRFSRKEKRLLLLFSFLGFTTLQVLYFHKFGEYCFTQKYKYPPRHLFLMHAFWYIFLLMQFESKLNFLGNNKVIVFISKSTLWIYLWHILGLRLAGKVIPNAHWSLKYVFVLSISLLLVFVQNKILDIIETKWKIPILKVFRG